MSNGVLEVSNDNFESEVVNSEKPVLVDFWAEWCGPCKQIAPVVEEIAGEHSDKLKVCKLLTYQNVRRLFLQQRGQSVYMAHTTQPKNLQVLVFHYSQLRTQNYHLKLLKHHYSSFISLAICFAA